MAREYFCAYHSLFESLKPFTDAECGRLFRAALKYSAEGTEVGLSGNERFIWPTIKMMIDRDRESYEAKCQVNRENGKKANGTERYRTVPNGTQEKEKEEDKQKEKEKSPSSKESIRPRGEYGWVKLTDDQYTRLLSELGQEELDRCIRYVDESAQKSGNKNRWKDWNLVIRNCHRDGWGIKNEPAKKPAGTPVNKEDVAAFLKGI